MKRSSHLVKGEGSGLGQTTRVVKVGTFGSRRISSGSREYSFTVEEGGSIEPGPEFNRNHDQIDGRTAKGKIFAPGGYDGYRVTGQIVEASLPSELTFQEEEVESGETSDDSGNGSGSNGSGSNGDSSNGGSNGDSSGSGGSGSDGSGGGSTNGDMVKSDQQAGMSTSTVLLGVGALAAVGIGIAAMSE